MKKHKNLIIFLTITLLRSIFLGMVKIFLRSALKEDHRTLEEIAGYLSIGFGLAYFVGGALTYAFRKKYITIISGMSIIICLVWGFLTDYFPFKNFAFLLMSIGFFTGLWLTVKSIIITIEIMKSKWSETTINAIVNITLLIGLLIGSYRGFGAYSWLKEVGFIAIVGLLFIATILAFFLQYDNEFKTHSIHSAIVKNIPNSIQAIRKYARILIPIAVGRGVSTGIMQKAMEIGLENANNITHNGIIIIVCTMIGTIVGNILGMKVLKKRQQTSNRLTLLLTGSILLFPLILKLPNTFLRLNIYNVYLGIVFGALINVREARFYHIIGEDNRKEFGSAAYGIINSIFFFLIMLSTNFLTNHLGNRSAFIFFGIVILACFPLIRKIR